MGFPLTGEVEVVPEEKDPEADPVGALNMDACRCEAAPSLICYIRCCEPCRKQALPYHHTAVYGTQPVKAVHGWRSRPPERGNVKKA